MKRIKLYEEFVNEATTSWKKMMQGVNTSETGPWSLVAIENKKVVGQKIDIKTKDIIPAHYEAMRKEFPRAKIHIEDGTGMVVWNESLELDENFPGPGKTVDAKDLDYDMLDYFSRTNKILSIDTKSKKGIKGSVGKMHGDLVFNGDDIKLKDIVSVKILEGTFNNNKEIAVYDGEDGLTYIEKRGKGYYGWNDEFDFEAGTKAELEKKLKSWKYKLVSGSIDESTELEEALNELALSSVGVKSFLRAMYTNADVIKKLGFKNFKDLTNFVKSSPAEEWNELKKEAEELGIVIAESKTMVITNEKTSDGRISDDEDEKEDTLMSNVESTIDTLIADIKKEANAIGGSFRSPGIESRVGKLIKAKLQKAKLI